MKITSKTDLEKIGFLDFSVSNTSIEKPIHSITFSITGALQLINNRCIELGKGNLKIIGYDSIFITSYNGRENTKATLTEDDFEPLRELCEIDVNEDNLIIKGFAENTWNWIEFTITGGKVEGEFEDTPEPSRFSSNLFK
jgi:hypothetical protein